MFKLLF